MTQLQFHYWCALVVFHLKPSVALAASLPEKCMLQNAHPANNPSSRMSLIAKDCESLGIESFDVYGDFHSDNKENSYLRQFESEVANDFGMEDAVFMPSGVMAQNIALLIHSKRRSRFACHHSSHLLLHEEDAYRELLHMEPLVLSTKENPMMYPYGVPPLRFDDVKGAFESLKSELNHPLAGDALSTFIIELPHRELGGKLTPWDDVLQIGKLCANEGVMFHCDGARIFEASAGYGLDLQEMSKPFDSIYISFYKGLGGMSGAMLLGDQAFCLEARKWLRRFGGNLFTLLPYAVSGWAGYKKHVKGVDRELTFQEKQKKVIRLVTHLSEMEDVSRILDFDPPVPEVNLVHGLLRVSAKDCLEASINVEKESGICVLSRVRDIDETEPAYQLGYKSKFELTIGDSNGLLDDSIFFRGWRSLAKELSHKGE